MTALYNETDAFAAAWLRELIKAGHIAPGVVDERPIQEVKASDVEGFTQCHFFAGIGGWSLALRLAGFDDSRLCWTGSCPCQPFSSAGKRAGLADERHLWPVWFSLIRESRPDVVFGEQVSSPDGLSWFDVVSADLEAEAYAVGALDTCAAGVGAPHGRQRLYFVADSGQRGRAVLGASRVHGDGESGDDVARRGAAHSMADPERKRTWRRAPHETGSADARPGSGGQLFPAARQGGGIGVMGNPGGAGFEGGEQELSHGAAREDGRSTAESGAASGFWSSAVWIPCRDGRSRAIEPGTFPLAHGIPGRVGRLRGYGNALCAPQAQAFIEAYLDVEAERRSA